MHFYVTAVHCHNIRAIDTYDQSQHDRSECKGNLGRHSTLRQQTGEGESKEKTLRDPSPADYLLYSSDIILKQPEGCVGVQG